MPQRHNYCFRNRVVQPLPWEYQSPKRFFQLDDARTEWTFHGVSDPIHIRGLQGAFTIGNPSTNKSLDILPGGRGRRGSASRSAIQTLPATP
jgi:hypothetical protein